jgi:hypothetical protein
LILRPPHGEAGVDDRRLMGQHQMFVPLGQFRLPKQVVVGLDIRAALSRPGG